MPVRCSTTYQGSAPLPGWEGPQHPTPALWLLLGAVKGAAKLLPQEALKTGQNRIPSNFKAIHTKGQDSLPFLFSIANAIPSNTQHLSPEILQWTSYKSLMLQSQPHKSTQISTWSTEMTIFPKRGWIPNMKTFDLGQFKSEDANVHHFLTLRFAIQ